MSEHNHAIIPSLDGIRAVSILIVFLAHAKLTSILPGGFGVTTFFFLSGFLITTLFFRESAKSGEINLRSFYLRRFFRLSPPLLVTLVIVYGLVGLDVLSGTTDLGSILSQVFYYYNYYSIFYPDSTQGAHGLNILWSLSVEEHFYLVYPFLFLGVLNGIVQIKHIILIVFSIMIWRYIRFCLLGADDYAIYVSTDTRLDSMLYGALLAMLVSKNENIRDFAEASIVKWTALIFAIVALIFSFVFRDDTFRSTLRYSLQGIALIPVFYYAVFYPHWWIFRFLNWPLFKMIGLYSYTIYLVHTVVLGGLRQSSLSSYGDLFMAIFAFGICISYAAILYHFVEKPVKNLRGRFASPALKQA